MLKQNQTLKILFIITGVIGLILALVILINVRFAHLWGIVLLAGISELAIGVLELTAGRFVQDGKKRALLLVASILGLAAFFPTAIASLVLLARKVKPLQDAAAAKG